MKAVVASVDVNAERLAGFLRAAGPLLRLPVSPTSALPSAERLGRIVKALRPNLEQSRTKGRYLNVWAMAGLKKDEVRNAAVLATLLDPQQLGGLSRAFLANILEEVGLGYPAFAAIDVMEPYSVMTEACPLGARETRIDIVLEGRRFLLGMEVKIEALERPRQLSDYQFILQRKARLFNKSAALIFLSPRPSQALPEGVPHLTWRKLAKAASKAVRDRPDASEAGNLLHQFSSHINTFR